MRSIDYICDGDPNPKPIEDIFPKVSGSPDNPVLLVWDARRILYLNIGASWTAIAQVGPNQVIQHLSEPLLGIVKAKLRAEPQNSPLCERFSQVLDRGI